MPPPGLYENDAGILDVFQGVFVQNGGKYASKMRAAIYSVLPLNCASASSDQSADISGITVVL